MVKRNYICHICQKRYNSVKELYNHYLTHPTIKDIIYDLYITQNLYFKDLMDKLSLNKKYTHEILNHFNITKDRSLVYKSVWENRSKEERENIKYKISESFDNRTNEEKERFKLSHKWTSEHKTQHSNTMKNIWDNKTPEEIKNRSSIISEKNKLSWKNKSEEELLGYKQKISQIYREKSDKEKENIRQKISKSNIETWKNKSKEDRNIYSLKSKEKFTPEFLKLISEIRKDWWNNDHERKVYQMKQTNLEKFGVETPLLLNENLPKNSYRTISKINLWWKDNIFHNNGIIGEDMEFPLSPYCYDFNINGILVEINPSITHNVNFNPFGTKVLDKNYHQLKSTHAKENGYRCIHIFDWDNPEKISYIFSKKEIIYARKCEVREIDKKVCNEFLENYHLQGKSYGNKINIGLFYNSELIQVMSFGNPRYNKKYEWELLRLCSHKDYKIIGGASKILKCFEENYSPKSLISYCDLSKFDGKVYQELGFKHIKDNTPSKHWYNLKTKQHITQALLNQRGVDQILKTNYGKNTNNEELLLENGFVCVYDCGQAVYIKEY